MTENKKIRVLAYCDSPTCATGFATVSRNIFEALYKTGRYEIDILGINYWGDPHSFPYRIWPTAINQEKDPYGRKKVCNMIPRMEYDMLFFLQDTFILDFLPELMAYLKRNNKNVPSICYYPIDGVPKEKWIKNVMEVDQMVAYSEFGKKQSVSVCKECGANRIEVIPHGVNLNDFHILPKEDVVEFKKRYFSHLSDHFIITNLNRNQQRKDIPRTITAFVEFRKLVPKSVLYLHMAKVDQGWNLPEVCKAYGLSISSDVLFPENFGPNQGYPIQIVNMLYNCSDCVVSTSLGEGFGLSWLESMATKKPVIMPNNTMFSEFITDDLGYLVRSGDTPSLKITFPHDNEVIRSLTDVDDLVAKMLDVYNNPKEAMRRAENAYKWVTTEMDWQGPIAKRWVDVFDKTFQAKTKTNLEEVPKGTKVIEAEEF